MKESGFRVRLDVKLRSEFLRACKERDLTAAQVLRAFMRSYVDGSPNIAQQDLFNHLVNSDATVSKHET